MSNWDSNGGQTTGLNHEEDEDGVDDDDDDGGAGRTRRGGGARGNDVPMAASALPELEGEKGA